MRHSLSSRFQGALLGAALGEILGTQCQARQAELQTKPSLSWLDVSHWGFSGSTAVKAGWGTVAVQLAKGLIQGGGGETSWIDEVLDVLSQASPQMAQNLSISDFANSPEASLVQLDAGLAIATLPIALFFHADPDQLEQTLQQADKVWQNQPELADGVVAIGYALSLALREQLVPADLIAELIEELKLNRAQSTTAPSRFIEQLQLMQTFNQTSLDALTQLCRSQLKSRDVEQNTFSIALALHCFLNTPDDFRISVMRAAQLHRDSQTISLTAALSGAYNGISGIPLSWRSALSRDNLENPTESLLNRLWEIASDTELWQLADQLLAAWSGAYDLTQLLRYPSQTLAIAAPRVIRPR